MTRLQSRSKKAQITLFIILGVVLLFSSGVFIYLSLDKEEESVLPPQRTPLENYVYECVRQTGEDAIHLLGNQGGYVKLPDQILDNPPSFISLDKNFYSIIPYWYYSGKTRIPSIDSMEKGVSEYVEKNLPGCIDSFSRFENQFDITILGNITAKTKIGEEAVVVTVDYPFEAYDYKSEKKTFQTFAASFNVKLKKIHAMATEIMMHENEVAFIENITIELMAIDDRVPFSGLEFSCDRKSWQLSQVKSAVEEQLKTNLPRIRFRNTDYMSFLNPENEYGKKEGIADAFEYFHFSVLPSKNSYDDLKATVVFYPELGLDMLARPMTRRGVLESSRGKGQDLLSYLCVQVYHFTYDLYFPVILMIRDDSAFKKDGFVFRFATPVMIDHNTANRKNVGFEELMLPSMYDPEFCSQRSQDEVEITATGSDGTYFGIELKDVNISYRCINLVCPLGMTKSVDGVYKLKTNLPSGCGYGTVIAEKPGYVSAEKRMTSDTLEVEMTKLHRLKLTFKAQLENALGTDKELADDETVVFYLTSKGYKYESQGYYDKKKEYVIDLIGDDATYAMDATLMRDDRIVGGFKGNITVKYSDIAEAKEVTFGVVKDHIVPVLDKEKLELITYIEGTTYQAAMQPKFN